MCQTMGGRHWVDAETDPPRSPAESLAALEIEPGYNIELIAAEPLIKDPVAIAFDQRGKMFVVEYGDYPIGPEEGDFKDGINTNSLQVLPNCQVEPGLADAEPGSRYQFLRLGYFCADAVHSAPGKPVFNRTVTLRDSWAKIEKKQKR